MTRHASGKHPSVYPHSSGKSCPQCSAPLNRVPRRLVDRLASLFTPTHRYKCQAFSCGWEGNLRIGTPVNARTSIR